MQIIQGISEKILIDRLIAGDQTAFELIFRHYYPGLVIFTAQITQNRDEAEEIVQDLFFRIWKQKNQIKGSLSLKPYLFTSVRNRGLNFLERKKTEARKIDEFREIIKNNLTFEPDIFVSSELQKRINQAFDKLPPRTKEIFILSRINELKNDEIAGKLEISKRTVETQISHALKILKHELKDYLVLLFLFDLFF